MVRGVQGYRRRVDEQEALTALATVGLHPRRAEPILGGWASWTFDLDGEHIVRFPRHDDVAAAARRELALLPELTVDLSYAVPNPTQVGVRRERPFFAYPRIPGRPLHADDASPATFERLREALGELHTFPVDRAAELVGAGSPEGAWRRHYDRLWPIIEQHALPVIEPSVADEVRVAFSAFVERIDTLPHCLVHNDLGLEHLLVDPSTNDLTGMIDFEDATIGDPAIDVVPLRAAFGREAVAQIFRGRDIGDRVDERLHFYRWMGSVHAIIYGVTQDVADELEHGRSELTRRLHSPVIG